MPTTEVIESLQGLALVCAIWVGMAVSVYALIGAIAHAAKIERLEIELNDEEDEI